jgi:hypothetical protein
VGVDPDGHRHVGTFLEDGQEHRGGQADFGQGQSSVEPLPVGCRQDRTTVLEPTQTSSGSGGCGATCRHPGTLRLQPQGSYRSFNKSALGR